MAKSKEKAEVIEIDIFADQSKLPVKVEDIIEGKGCSDLLMSRGAMQAIVDHVETMVTSEVCDPETPKGRKQMKSLAAKVSSSRKLFEVPCRDEIRTVKAKPKIMTENIGYFCDEFDRIRDKVKAPAVEWQAEQDRIAKVKQDVIDYFPGLIEELKEHLPAIMPNARVEQLTSMIEHIKVADVCGADDRLEEAEKAKADCIMMLEGFLASAEKEVAIAVKAENDRVEAIRKQAKIEAEEAAELKIKQAALDVQAAEKRVIEQKDFADRQQAEAERQKSLAAENAVYQAEQAAIKATEKAEWEARQEAQKLIDDAEALKEKERLKAENKEHQKAMNIEAMTALMNLGIERGVAQEVVKGAVLGNLGSLRMYY